MRDIKCVVCHAIPDTSRTGWSDVLTKNNYGNDGIQMTSLNDSYFYRKVIFI